MGFFFGAEKLKRLAKLGVERTPAIAHNRQAATLGGTVFGEKFRQILLRG